MSRSHCYCPHLCFYVGSVLSPGNPGYRGERRVRPIYGSHTCSPCGESRGTPDCSWWSLVSGHGITFIYIRPCHLTYHRDNQINFALFHCLGPSIQTALFNAPLVVIVGWGLGKDMDLNFKIFMVVLLVLSILVVGNFLRDRKSNYLEGALCVLVYVIIAVTTWYYPNLPEGPWPWIAILIIWCGAYPAENILGTLNWLKAEGRLRFEIYAGDCDIISCRNQRFSV